MSNKDFNMRAYIDIVNEANGMSRYAQRTLNQYKSNGMSRYHNKALNQFKSIGKIQSAADALGKLTPEQLQAMNLAAKKPGPMHDALGHPGHNHDEPMDEAAGHTKDHVHTGGDTTDMSPAEIETMNKRLDKHAPGRGSDEKGGAPYTRGDVTYKHETPGKPGWNIGLTDAKMKELNDRLRSGLKEQSDNNYIGNKSLDDFSLEELEEEKAVLEQALKLDRAGVMDMHYKDKMRLEAIYDLIDDKEQAEQDAIDASYN